MIFEVLWPRAGGVPECSYSVPGTSGAWIGDAPHRGDEVRHEDQSQHIFHLLFYVSARNKNLSHIPHLTVYKFLCFLFLI